MLKEIFRRASFTFVSIALIFTLFFSWSSSTLALIKGWDPPQEGSLSSEANGNNPLGIVIEPSSDDQSLENEKTVFDKDNYPDLGSEQVFPFEPGLGNSAF